MQDFRSRWLVHHDLYYRVAFMILGDESMAALARAMERMSDNQRKVVRLKYLEGLDNDEIRHRTGLSAVNIRVLLSRAKSVIRSYLNNF